jgi:pyruvate/2-oxoglutarate dehydrogenase complex dihydrolipoamide dehydrogenase (E3) component
LGVQIRLNEECIATTVEKAKPDAVVVATGAKPLIPNLPGIKSMKVVTAIEVLEERKEVGQDVVVVGGGSIGCETAEFLHRKGKKVTLLEMLDRIGEDIGPSNRWLVIDRLSSTVRIETKAKVEEITDEGVRISWAGKYPEFFEADSVVIAVGMEAVDQMVKELEGKVESLYHIGDCAKPGKVREAVAGGFQAGFEV